MVPLMSRIAWLICDKVARHINPHTVLTDLNNLGRTITICKEAQTFLLAWEDTYLDVSSVDGTKACAAVVSDRYP